MTATAKKTTVKKATHKSAAKKSAKKTTGIKRTNWTDATLTVVAKENPCREGTPPFKLFEALKKKRSIEAITDAIAKEMGSRGRAVSYVRLWVGKNLIKVA